MSNFSKSRLSTISAACRKTHDSRSLITKHWSLMTNDGCIVLAFTRLGYNLKVVWTSVKLFLLRFLPFFHLCELRYSPYFHRHLFSVCLYAWEKSLALTLSQLWRLSLNSFVRKDFEARILYNQSRRLWSLFLDIWISFVLFQRCSSIYVMFALIPVHSPMFL